MNTKEIKLYSLQYSDWRAYMAVVAFVAGNILLPQLCHLVPQGGITFLPIYFFTLIAAYKYGWRVGLMTAILSPIANHLLFGMPAAAVMPIILIKSTLLALSASFVSSRVGGGVSLLHFALIAFLYQGVGTLAEWALVGEFWLAAQDLRIGLPGILIQIFGGYSLIRYLLNR